jgi:hypothetical protein
MGDFQKWSECAFARGAPTLGLTGTGGTNARDLQQRCAGRGFGRTILVLDAGRGFSGLDPADVIQRAWFSKLGSANLVQQTWFSALGSAGLALPRLGIAACALVPTCRLAEMSKKFTEYFEWIVPAIAAAGRVV